MSAQLDALLALAEDYTANIASLSPDTLAVLFYAYPFLASRRNWLAPGEVPADVTDDDWDTILKMVDGAMREIMTGLVGVIMDWPSDDIPETMLECNGDAHSRLDFPILYAMLPAIFILDADTFVTPDLRDRFVMTKGDLSNIGDTGGEALITLGSENIPGHSHDATVIDPGHFHGDNSTVPVLINGGVEAPAAAAQYVTGVTTSNQTGISVQISNFGDNEPFDAKPPYIVLRKVIIAG